MIRVRVSADNFNLIDEPKTLASIRDVPIARVLAAELERWHLSCGSPEAGLVFTGRNGLIVAQASIAGIWVRLQHRVFGDGHRMVSREVGRFLAGPVRRLSPTLVTVIRSLPSLAPMPVVALPLGAGAMLPPTHPIHR